MKCFYHHDRDAVGTCKSCQRGVCPECAVEFPRGLACRGRCETDAQALIALVDRNVKLSPLTQQLLKSTRARSLQSAGFYVVLGAIFLGMGIHRELDFSTMVGALFIIFGIIQGARTLQLIKATSKE